MEPTVDLQAQVGDLVRDSFELELLQAFIKAIADHRRSAVIPSDEERPSEGGASSEEGSSEEEGEFRDAKRTRKSPANSTEPVATFNPFGVLDGAEGSEMEAEASTSAVGAPGPGGVKRKQTAAGKEPDKRSRKTPNPRRVPQPGASGGVGSGSNAVEPASGAQSVPFEQAVPKKIPAITIHDKDRWLQICSALRAKGIEFTKAENHFDGIHVSPASADDHRKLSRWLEDERIGHHVYRLPQDKPLRVVIRGLPHGFPCEAIKEELVLQGLPVLEVTKLRAGGALRRESHLAYVTLTKGEQAEAIFSLTELAYLKVKVESKRRPEVRIRQCFNCQLYGHTSGSCKAATRCVKCAGSHATKDCKLEPGSEAVCINCQRGGRTGNHAASDKACPFHPAAIGQRKATGRKSGAGPAQTARKDMTYAAVVGSSTVRKEVRPRQPAPAATTEQPTQQQGPRPSAAAAEPSAAKRRKGRGKGKGKQQPPQAAANPEPAAGSSLESAQVWNAFQKLLTDLLAAPTPAAALALFVRPSVTSRPHNG